MMARQSPKVLKGEDPALREPADPIIKIKAPVAPNKRPMIFLEVIGSFKINAANIIVHIGREVVIMEAFAGEVNDTEKIKQP